MPEIIVEECSRGGVHFCFHSVSSLPVRIGRAFDNDIVIADPFVAPVHLIIEKGEQGWQAVDQGSGNGSFIGKGAKIEKTAALISGDTVTIGRTLLRFWSPGHRVPAELSLPAQQSRVRRIVMPTLAVMSLIGVSGALTMHQFLENATRVKTISHIAGALPYLLFPLLWAGTCACAGFIVRRRANFSLQLMASNVALFCVIALASLADFVDYFTGSTTASDITQYAGIVLITILLLFSNISIITGIANVRRAMLSAVIGIGIIAAVALTDIAARSEKRITPEYSQTLKPPYAKIAKSISLDRFIGNCESLFGGEGEQQTDRE
jgi:hypothetical protein